jgi:thiol-disulfide isomerase/thioredoxin
MTYLSCLRFVALAGLCGMSTLASAADAPLAFPAHPAQWVNSRPLTVESLAGKAAVLWFYEEQCPKCREKWPAMVAMAKKFEGQPVIFIAVNSGNPRPAVEQYLQQNRIPWPTIVDPTREFERAIGIDNPISLQNIHQVKVLTPAGRFENGDWSDLEATAARVAAGAKWKIDPSGMPPALMPAWQALELGDFISAGPVVKKALNDKKPEVKEAATKLNDFAQGELTKAIDAVKQQADAGNKWAAYQAARNIVERFKGYDLPDDFKTAGRDLAQDEEVKKQLAAFTQLEAIKKTLVSTSAAVRKKAVDKLDKFILENTGTDAAAQAEAIKGQLGAG